MQPVNVCHVIASLAPETGGPARSVPRLVQALSPHDVRGRIVFLTREGDDAPEQVADVLLSPVGDDSRNPLRYSPRLRTALSSLQDIGIVHNHGLWLHPNLAARRFANARNLPLVTSPRGMLLPECLQRSRGKKAAWWIAAERSNLLSARAFHATSFVELESIRRMGFRQPVAVIPNGIDAGPVAPEAREELLRRFPQLRGARILLFMSRLHPRKGLDMLLSCWERLEPRFDEWVLVVAGKIEEPYTEAANRAKRNVITLFTGWMEGPERDALLEMAELFVLPTDTENFGMAIGEALAHGTPVITTRNTPWDFLEAQECGCRIDRTEEALSEALCRFLSMDRADLSRLGANGRREIETRFTWNGVAARMAEFYRWLVQMSDRPECVDVSSPSRGVPRIL